MLENLKKKFPSCIILLCFECSNYVFCTEKNVLINLSDYILTERVIIVDLTAAPSLTCASYLSCANTGPPEFGPAITTTSKMAWLNL